jgi:hypothetical protein
MPFKLHRRLLNGALKGAVAGLLLWAIYRQVLGRSDAAELWAAWQQQLQGGQWPWLALAIGLMPLNWALEAEKWRYLLAPSCRLPFGQALRAVFCGLALSLFTPQRIGEYVGRVLGVPARHNWAAVLAMAVGNFAQLLVLLSFGLAGASLLLGAYLGNPIGWGAAAAILLAALYLLFFNLDRLPGWLRKLPLPRRVWRLLLMLRQYRAGQLTRAWGWSAARYATYSVQYYALAMFFGIGAPPLMAFAAIASVFLIQTSLPLPPLMGLLARGEAALLIWGHFSEQPLGILAATYGLFILNLCLPALLGLGFIVKTNILKSLGYENDLLQSQPFRRFFGLAYGFRTTRKR